MIFCPIQLLGVTANAKIRLQFNIEVIPYAAMATFRNASQAVIPFGWLEMVKHVKQLFHTFVKIKLWQCNVH